MTDVSIVIPCLNEASSLAKCLANAHSALAAIVHEYGLSGEVIVADNGSTDGSQAIAARAGARVVPVAKRGYGAALIGGFNAAEGRFLVMADADCSYDFHDAVPMIGRLMRGAELCMGSRFLGEIKAGAMPWKNRYIGNPVLSGILRLLFRTPISDAHCGIRALTKDCFQRLRLSGSGMEFASEMVIKASLLNVRMDETPATLHPDERGRAPHLRPWRDGWRHLRYLLMLSPGWIFLFPALAGATVAFLIMAVALTGSLLGQPTLIGNYWSIFAAAALQGSHVLFFMGAAAQIFGVKEGYRQPGSVRGFAFALSLEKMLMYGLLLFGLGAAILLSIVFYWSAQDFAKIGNVLPAVAGTSMIIIGVQNILGGFLLSIVSGNDPGYLSELAAASKRRQSPAPQHVPAGEMAYR